MSDLTFVPFLDGTILPSTDINEAFSLFTEINGSLTDENVAGISAQLSSEQIQHGAVSGGKMVGGTANLDYFNGVRYQFNIQGTPGNKSVRMKDFNDNFIEVLVQDKVSSEFKEVKDPVTHTATAPIAIPGASVTFFLPYKAYVLLTWQITWTSDAVRDGPTPQGGQEQQGTNPDPELFPEVGTAIRLFVDGSEFNNACLTRESKESLFNLPIENPGDKGTGSTVCPHRMRDRYKSRYWSGHAFILKNGNPLLQGFHTASLRVISHNKVRQVRIRCRNMKVLHFKAP